MSGKVKGIIAAVAVVLIAGGVVYATTSSADANITEAEAKQIALAEVPGADTSNITKFEKDTDDGRMEYDVEIIYDGYEYDFEISAEDGTIFDRSKDVADAEDLARLNMAQGNTQPSSETQASQQTTDDGQTVVVTPTESAATSQQSGISFEEAKSIALGQVPGAAEANITKAEKDEDDGRIEFEIEIKYNGYEYDFEISAATGEIISKDVDRDDD